MELRVSSISTTEAIMKPRNVVTGVDGRLRLVCGTAVVFDEPAFPVVELAVALSRWVGIPREGRGDFEFDSMFAEEPGILWIRESARSWRLGSIWQDAPCFTVLTIEEVDDVVRNYLHSIRGVLSELDEAQALAWFQELLDDDAGYARPCLS